jgi:hypothetical protein
MPKDFKWKKCIKKTYKYCRKKGEGMTCAKKICGSIKARYG